MTNDDAPGGLPSPGSPDLPDDRRRRVEALRALASQQPSVAGAPQPASQQPSSRSAPISLAPPRRQRPLWLRVGALALLIAVIAGAALFALRFTTPNQIATTPSPTPVELDLTAGQITCTYGAAWSPNGAYIAAYGILGLCGDVFLPEGRFTNSTGPASLAPQTVADFSSHLAILDAQHRQLMRSFNLDTLVEQLALPARIRDDNATRSSVNIAYLLVSWSPDSRTVAFLAAAGIAKVTGNTYQNTIIADGLLLVDATTGSGRFIASTQGHPPSDFSPSPIAQNLSPIAWWDVQTGTLAFQPVPSGLSFTWGNGDTLTASQRSGAEPIGSPDGGQSFTIYSHARISLLTPACTGRPQSSTFYEIDAAFPVWSPDGRYILDYVSGEWRLGTPVTNTPPSDPLLGTMCIRSTVAPEAPAIPVRDAGLTSALHTLNENNGYMAASWSPDGKLLAVGQWQSATLKAGIVVYDCATGKRLAMLASMGIIEPSGEQPLPLRWHFSWSPDGKVLLVSSVITSHLLLLRPTA